MSKRERLALGTCAFGRAIDAYGRPIDNGPPLRGCRVGLAVEVPSPSARLAIETPLWTGVRVLDGLLTIGRGARVGIFGVPGAGKSTLLESIVEGAQADATVVALVGERGREARQWMERLSPDSTIICATSDRPAAERIRAMRVAMAHADALRRRGLHVLLLLDSLARCAAALRERAVAAGESVGRGGYPPSVFAEMAALVEIAGPCRDGSITLIATVIHDGDERDPVSEAARSMLDGHITLSRRLADAGRFPAVDLPASASRTMQSVAGDEHLQSAAVVRRAVVALERVEDARSLGLEPNGADARAAITNEGQLEWFLRQDRHASDPAATLALLHDLAQRLSESGSDVLRTETLR